MKRFVCKYAFALALAGCSLSRESPQVLELDFAHRNFVCRDSRPLPLGEGSGINSLDVLCFGPSGLLVWCDRSMGSDSVSALLPVGMPLQYRLVANAPWEAFEEVGSLDAYESRISFLLENSRANFVMTAGGECSFRDNGTLEVALKRLASRVSVDAIVPEFFSEDMKNLSCTLDAIYLINVPADCNFSTGLPTMEKWYHKMGFDDSCPDVIADLTRVELDIPVTDNLAIPITNSDLYCYPNPTENGVNSVNTPQWSVRDTRLVVEITFDGNKYYYPVNIPAMQGNMHYHIGRIILSGLGSHIPDAPPSRDSFSFSVSVEPWGRCSQSPEL